MTGAMRRKLIPTARNLQLVSAIDYGPTSLISAAISAVTATSLVTRAPFVIGSGDVSQIVLSFFAWYLQKLVGVTAIGNGFTVNSCSIEYNGAFQPVTFSGGRSLSVSSGNTDIQADGLPATAFGLSAFTQGSIGYVRMQCSFAAAQTDKFAKNSYIQSAGSASQLLYDPLKCSVTNGVDATGAIAFSMTNGGVFGTDAISPAGFFTPIVLGKFVNAGRLPTCIISGDSIAAGALDQASNAMSAAGYSRALLPSGVASGAGAVAGLNLSCAGGIGSDWANGTPSLLTKYLGYGKYAFEAYGANNATVSMSTNIHAQLRAAGIASIFRISLTPSTSSTDSWASAANQAYQANYGPGSNIASFHTSLAALVAADYSYFDPLGMRDGSGSGDYWKWFTNGTAAYAVHTDGLHPTSAGYELLVGGTANVTAQGGTSSTSMRSLIASLN